MVVTTLYATLVGASGVFLGLLTAHLTSQITSHRAEKEALQTRYDRLTERLNTESEKLSTVKRDLASADADEERIRSDQHAVYDARDFLTDYVGKEWAPDPDSVTEEMVREEFKKYVQSESFHSFSTMSHHELQLIMALKLEVKNTLQTGQTAIEVPDPPNPSERPRPLIGDLDRPTPRRTPDALKIAFDDDELLQSIRNRQKDLRLSQSQHQVELNRLKREQNDVEERYDAISFEHLKSDLGVVGVASVLSIVIPVFTILLIVTNAELYMDPIAGVQLSRYEAPAVFGIWITGLALVFIYMLRQLKMTQQPLSE